MPRKKVSSKKDLVAISEELRQQLAEVAQQQVEGVAIYESNVIKYKHGYFELNDSIITTSDPDGKYVDTIILAHKFERVYYDGPYVEGEQTPPACFALSDTDPEINEALRPCEESVDAQHKTCAGCPQNEYGTSQTGKGKACSTRVRLLLAEANQFAENEPGKISTAVLNIPVTSYSLYKKHIGAVAGVLKLPIFAVVTRIRLERTGSYDHPAFELVAPLESGDLVQKALDMSNSAGSALDYKYKSEDKDFSGPAGKKKIPVKKKKARKKSAVKKKKTVAKKKW